VGLRVCNFPGAVDPDRDCIKQCFRYGRRQHLAVGRFLVHTRSSPVRQLHVFSWYLEPRNEPLIRLGRYGLCRGFRCRLYRRQAGLVRERQPTPAHGPRANGLSWSRNSFSGLIIGHMQTMAIYTPFGSPSNVQTST